MSEENVELVRNHFIALGKGDFLTAKEQLADDYVAHSPDGDFPGKEAQMQRWQRLGGAFERGKSSIHDVFGADDKVAIRLSGKFTQTGDWMGVPAAGQQATSSRIIILRVKDGKIAESWRESSDLQVLRQLGIKTIPER
jgi:predicted ester cyclase